MTEPDGYRQAVEAAAVADRSDRGRLAVAGADHRAFLHALLTQDIQSLAAGHGRYAAYLTAQGRMITDMTVYELGGAALLDLPPGLAAPLAERFDALVFSEDVRLADVSEAWGGIRVVGPAAHRVVTAAVAALSGDGGGTAGMAEIEGLVEHAVISADCAGAPVHVAMTREWGLAGFDLFAERAASDRLRAFLLDAGVAPLSPEAAEALRIEAGTPRFPGDLGTDTIPLEAGIEARAISFTKGCYPGQELIIRVLHRGGGRVARRLVGLLVEGTRVPSGGDALAVGGSEAGRVTSAAWSPALGRPIALGYLRHDVSAPGSSVEVRAEGWTAPAQVTRPPLVDRRLPASR